MTDLAALFRDSLLAPEISERHTVYAVVHCVEPEHVNTEAGLLRFVDMLKAEARHMVRAVEHDARRGQGVGIVGADVTHETKTDVYNLVAPDGTASQIEETTHKFTVAFTCTGQAPDAPRAAVLKAMGAWLLVSSVEFVEVGARINTPSGERTVVSVDHAHKVLGLDTSIGPCRGFPLYYVGDTGALDFENL